MRVKFVKEKMGGEFISEKYNIPIPNVSERIVLNHIKYIMVERIFDYDNEIITCIIQRYA